MAKSKPHSRKKEDATRDSIFKLQVDLEKAFSLIVEYDSPQIKEIIQAYLLQLYKRGAIDLHQNMNIVENSSNLRKWIVEPLVKEEDTQQFTSLLAWYKENGASLNELVDNRKLDLIHKRAESFFQWAASLIMQSLSAPILCASILDATGNNKEALVYLLNSIVIGLQRDFGLEQGNTSESQTTTVSEESTNQETIQNWKFSFTDDCGGTFSGIYKFRPALENVYRLFEERINNNYASNVEKEIAHRKVNTDEAEDIRRRRSKQKEVMIRIYNQLAQKQFEKGLIAKLKAALSEHVMESLYITAHEWNELRFEDEKKESVKFKYNTTAILNSILKQTIQRTRRRLRAPKQGGARRRRIYFESSRDRIFYASKVNTLKQPFRDKKNVWEYIIDLMEFEQYDLECIESLKAKTSLKDVPFHLIKEAFTARKQLWEKGQNIPRRLSPFAFILKHACCFLEISTDEISYETLRRRYREGQQQLEAIEKMQNQKTEGT